MQKEYPLERIIYTNQPDKNVHFVDNYVRTSKYSIITFLPKYLISQFMRVANFYFLIIAALQLIPGLSPTGRTTTLFGLIIVLTLNGIKEVLEDIRRHKQDKEVNNRLVHILKDKKWVPIKWSELRPGVVVRLKDKEFIPADLVLLNSSEHHGICYIETASLDGETNLKIRQAHNSTTHLVSEAEFSDFKGVIECENRNVKLYDFDGVLTLDGKTQPLTATQLLLRGASIQNTEWVIAVSVNTGVDTKLVLNSTEQTLKISNVERKTNQQIFLVFILLGIIALIGTIGSAIWNSRIGEKSWYLEDDFSVLEGIRNFFTFIVLFNNLIPISLYVSMEFVKFGQAYFINNDLRMYHEKTDTPANARTSTLNEELGQVQYIFSDKTGTLTQNQMQFRNCTIGGISYGKLGEKTDSTKPLVDRFVNFDDPTLLQNLKAHETSETIREFLLILAICHTVIPQTSEDDPGQINYQAASPDEAALVRAARQLGFVFTKRTPTSVSVSIEGKNVTYELLNIIEFNSTRKRMSVIVRTPEGKIMIYCKGADSVIFERLADEQNFKEITEEHLKAFAATGLRTLCLAYKELNREEYEIWAKEYHEASTQIKDREKAVTRVAEQIEKKLHLIGATAIEDKLQEGVPETIVTLANAGIRIWVLTGDKQETAINIGFACALLSEDMDRIVINKNNPVDTENMIDEYLEKYKDIKEADDGLGLVVDGQTLHFCLSDSLKLKFLELATKCKAVICCRVSPLQKALVVQLVKDNLKCISLAIGDGGNDVSMIQAAHVGVGISGEEGLQAARASDYSISQFRFLVPLLLLHGRYAYRSISKLIQYSFYKNIVLVFTQFWFIFFNGFSGQTLYEKWTLSLFNVIFAFLPIITLGIFDRDFDAETIMDNPQLYYIGQKNQLFKNSIMVFWILNGIYHSALIFFLTLFAYVDDSTTIGGRQIGLFGWGITSFTCVILVITLKVALETRRWVLPHHIAVWGSILVWFLFNIVYSPFWIELNFLSAGAEVYLTIFELFGSSVFWLTILLVTVICLLRDVIFKYFRRNYLPKPHHIVQEMEKQRQKEDLKLPKRHARETMYQTIAYTGFGFEKGIEVEVMNQIIENPEQSIEQSKQEQVKQEQVKQETDF